MSLYIQITKRCNMSCNHCSFRCGERGPDMDAAIFRRVLELSEREETPITLGGGEPTLHPLFMDFLWWSIRAKAALTYELGMPAVGLVTNIRSDNACATARLSPRLETYIPAAVASGSSDMSRTRRFVFPMSGGT